MAPKSRYLESVDNKIGMCHDIMPYGLYFFFIIFMFKEKKFKPALEHACQFNMIKVKLSMKMR